MQCILSQNDIFKLLESKQNIPKNCNELLFNSTINSDFYTNFNNCPSLSPYKVFQIHSLSNEQLFNSNILSNIIEKDSSRAFNSKCHEELVCLFSVNKYSFCV